MKLKYLAAAAAVAAAFPSEISAQEFFSVDTPTRLFTIGVRAGFNASNRTASKKVFNAWNCDSWGTGFDAGVVVDLHVRDYISIQPGFFFETRSGNFAYSTNFYNAEMQLDNMSQMGHYRNSNFNVPVVASLHFNLSDNIRWNVEFGPNFHFCLGSSDADKVHVMRSPIDDLEPQTLTAEKNTFDFGLKIGTGLTFNRHWSLNAHYVAGLSKVWKNEGMDGHRKSWVFTAGYDF